MTTCYINDGIVSRSEVFRGVFLSHGIRFSMALDGVTIETDNIEALNFVGWAMGATTLNLYTTSSFAVHNITTVLYHTPKTYLTSRLIEAFNGTYPSIDELCGVLEHIQHD